MKENDIMICPNCKTPNLENSIFCANCGASLKNSQQINSSNYMMSEQGIGVKQKKKLTNGQIIAIVLSSVGVLCLLVVSFVFGYPALRKAFAGMKTKDYLDRVEDQFNNYKNWAEDVQEGLTEGADININIPSGNQETTPGQNTTPEVNAAPDQSVKPDSGPITISPEVTSPYRLMNVTSNIGLNVRSSPNTGSPVLAVLIQDRHVFVEKVENNWAYVNCGDIKGWCSLDYLSDVPFQSTKVYRQDEITTAKSEANKIVNSYLGKTPAGGRTDITVENVIQYFESCQDIYSFNASFGEQFEKLIPIAADSEYVYYFVDDSKCRSVADLCDKYYSCFSDDIAARCLDNKVLLLDGKLAVAFRSDAFNGYYVSHTYNVQQVSDTRIDVNVVVKEYSKDSLTRDSSGKATADSPIYEVTYTFPCVVEDGVWVFQNMDMIFD